MEVTIRTVIIVILLIIVALVVLSLFGVFGERSNWLVDGIFGFFNELFGGKNPLDAVDNNGGAQPDGTSGGSFSIP